MSILTHIVIAVLSGYLAFTNLLADQIHQLLSTATPETTTAFTLRTLPSNYPVIPQILTGTYGSQVAAVAGVANEYTTNPKDALVNILCTHSDDTTLTIKTGSGVIIDSDGVILTNAHVAQNFLLEGIVGDTNCYIRTGDPARATYEAELLYISPAWVLKNAPQIIARTPVGTGERDYALLYITGGLNNKPLPKSFPALRFNATPFNLNYVPHPIIASGYPAVSPFAKGGDGELVRVSATSSITELMTFATDTPDLFTISGTTVGEQGASGGPITTADGTLIGLISTRGDDAQFGAGSLRALTMSYIAHTYQEETTISLLEGMSGDLHLRARRFNDALVPILQQLLMQELESDS